MKKVLALIMALVMMLSLLTGCNQTAEPAEPAESAQAEENAQAAAPAETVAADSEEAEEINYLTLGGFTPNETQSGFQPVFNIGQEIFTMLIWDSLCQIDMETLETVNVLAKDVAVSDDGMTWTVTLKDAKWHDGEPVTADDVVFSFNFIIKAAGGTGANFNTVKGYDELVAGTADALAGLTAKDEKTVVFELTQPNYVFDEAVLANHNNAIMPEHLLGGMDVVDALACDYWNAPVGSGPYKIDKTDYPNYVTLIRNEEYHTGVAGIKQIMLPIYQGDGATTAAMAGEMHYQGFLNEIDADAIVASSGVMAKKITPSGYMRYLTLNHGDNENSREDLKNLKVREGLWLAIDRQAVVDFIGDSTTVATTMSRFDFNTDIPVWERDVEKAKQLLEEGGFDFSTPLRLTSTYTDQQTVDVLDIIAASLQEVGIQTEIAIETSDPLGMLYDRCDFDLYYGGYAETGIKVYSNLASGTMSDPWFTEEMLADLDADYTALINEYYATKDDAGRDEIVKQIQLNFMEDMYNIPVFFREDVCVYHEDFQGFEPVPVDYWSYGFHDTTKWSFG